MFTNIDEKTIKIILFWGLDENILKVKDQIKIWTIIWGCLLQVTLIYKTLLVDGKLKESQYLHRETNIQQHILQCTFFFPFLFVLLPNLPPISQHYEPPLWGHSWNCRDGNTNQTFST